MRAIEALCLLSLLLVGTPHPARAADRLGIIARLPADLRPVDARLFEEALRSAALRVARQRAVSPQRSREQLAQASRPGAARAQAEALLARGMALARKAQYEEAAAELRRAERAALDGLARVVEPRLLGEILLHKGLAQEAMAEPAAGETLVAALALWPRAALQDENRSPKILAALKLVATAARAVGPPRIDAREALAAAEILGVRRVAEVTLLRPVDEAYPWRAELRAIDPLDEHAPGPVVATWPRTDTRGTIEARLERALRRALGLPDEPVARRTPTRRILAWVTAGTALALAVTGTALLVQSSNRVAEAERLVTSPPTVEYAPAVENIEASARELKTGGIATLVGAGIAGAASAVLFLLGRPRRAAALAAVRDGAGLRRRF